MLIIPAIDIKGGRCVRLVQGRMDAETVYSEDPVAVARKWSSLGAELIHLVDLDGAVEGRLENFGVIEEIVASLEVPVQIGGGIRDASAADKYLGMDNVKRIIIGTRACEEPGFVTELTRSHPGRVAVGIDAKDGMVAVKGWVEVTGKSALELAATLEEAGAACIIYTDISRDGMLTGPNVDATIALAAAVNIPVIASGGMSSIGDIEALKSAERERDVRLEGVIVGKALYSGNIKLTEAIKRAKD